MKSRKSKTWKWNTASKWEKRSLLDATIQLKGDQTVHAISLHHLPSEQGIPNTAAYINGISEPLIMMGDFNYTGEIEDFLNIGVLNVDSAYMQHHIDRIFYSEEWFETTEIGTLPDTTWVSDHPANFARLKLMP